MSNPLQSLAESAKSQVRSTVEWAYGPERLTKQTGKSDQVFRWTVIDILRRAAYHSVFDTLFRNADEFPYLNPDKTLKRVVAKLKTNMFPTGTKMTVADENANSIVQELLRQIRFQLRVEDIVEESALMGYCGLRTIWSEEYERWVFEVKPKEYLVIESDPNIPDEVLAIGLEWPVEREERVLGGRKVKKRYWRKERWTETDYTIYKEKAESVGKKPVFEDKDIDTVEPNIYEEIPITIIPHYYSAKLYGIGVVQEEEILEVKSLLRLRHKMHFGHLKYMDPNLVIKNRSNPGEPINLGIGNVIDIGGSDEKMPVDASLLEFSGMPDSVKYEMFDHTKALYEAAGLKAPPPEEVFKPSMKASGVALRLRDKDDCDTIQTLRDNGYSEVLRHLEKILRMGSRINVPEFNVFNTEDPESWTITATFPDFFPPTEEEISMKIANLKLADLPPEIAGRMVASLYGIEDEKELQSIIDRWVERREQEQVNLNDGGFQPEED